MQRSTLIVAGLVVVALALLARANPAAVDAIAVNAKRLLPRGLRNNNPGNLRTLPAKSAWLGQVGDDNGYAIYSSIELGVRAAGKQLLKYETQGLRTVREIVSRWAPASENNTAAYVAAVSSALNLAADQRFSVSTKLAELASAIFRHELGAVAFAASSLTPDNVKAWVNLP